MTTDELQEALLDLHGAVSLLSVNIQNQFNLMEKRFADMDRRFDAMDQRFERIESTLSLHSAALNRIERRLDHHGERIAALEQRYG